MAGRMGHAVRRVGVVVGRVSVYVLLWAGLALLVAAAGIRFFWGEISVGQMLLNLVSVETDGGGGIVVWLGILGVGVVPLLVTVGIALWQHLRRRTRHRGDETRPRRARWIVHTVSTALVAAVAVGGTTAFATTVGVGDYLRAAKSPYDIGDHYVAPTVTGDEHRRNLVLIYLESGEATLADQQLVEEDPFAPLEEVTEAPDGWRSVDGLRQYRGGGWTMAGLVSTQCGIPLKALVSAEGSGASDGLDGDLGTYLGGVTCLGDVLAERGYRNVFLGGANPSFAAKDTFLRSHGYSEVRGLADWRAAGEPERHFRSDWGLSDARLMAHAKDRVDELHAEAQRSGRPFHLSVLTLDTHEPVHVFDYCTVGAQNKVSAVFSCSMTQVAGFVDHMREKGYLDDTAVVIMGDHLVPMRTGDALHEKLGDHGNRTVFNRIWIPGAAANSTLRPRVDQLSMYPTILEAAGLTLEDHEAGLGVSAFTPEVPDGSAQAMEPGPYAELLDSRSPRFFAEAWAGEDAAR